MADPYMSRRSPHCTAESYCNAISLHVYSGITKVMEGQLAREKARRSKSQTLSLRLNPKTRFVLEFLAKIHRRSITMIVEDAIKQAGSKGTVSHSFESEDKTWFDFWDFSEGVREMRMLADPDVPSDFEDDERRAFIAWHIEFFSQTYEMSNPDRINIEIIWPKIDQFIEHWNDTKRTNPWAAGEQMVMALDGANIPAPVWPRREKEPPKPLKPSVPKNDADDFDDEIPF